MTDLIERLQVAASDAIANERPSLVYEPHRLRGVTLELRIDGKGAVVESTCWVERRTKVLRGDRPAPAGRG